MKGYTVFNVEQIEGLPEIYYANAVPTLDPVARIEHAEKFFASIGATIRHGGNRAYHAQELDYVQMPPLDSFRDAESYYSTLAHELTHWTKHELRLNRDFGRKRWGDAGYASEELVAELGSAFLVRRPGVAPGTSGRQGRVHCELAGGSEERQSHDPRRASRTLQPSHAPAVSSHCG
jgi:antirestriction protein ArdC